jgi:hypothetical protein
MWKINTLEVQFHEGFYPSENLHIMNTYGKQNAMCDISRVFNTILTIANGLIINLKSTGTLVGFR